ncbi:MAG: hypothetical protein QXM68_03905 [Candidatus Aenigmatarchaeota archaeon]|nr:hypothetical protein [Candidatus Aenigmarchaeota archaeon]
MSNLFSIIIDSLTFLIKSIAEVGIFIINKLFEFTLEIVGISNNPISALIGAFILGLIFFIAGKYLFGLTKEFTILLIIYVVLVIIYFLSKFIL